MRQKKDLSTKILGPTLGTPDLGGACFSLPALFASSATRLYPAISRENERTLHCYVAHLGALLRGFAPPEVGYTLVSIRKGRSPWTPWLGISFFFSFPDSARFSTSLCGCASRWRNSRSPPLSFPSFSPYSCWGWVSGPGERADIWKNGGRDPACAVCVSTRLRSCLLGS